MFPDHDRTVGAGDARQSLAVNRKNASDKRATPQRAAERDLVVELEQEDGFLASFPPSLTSHTPSGGTHTGACSLE